MKKNNKDFIKEYSDITAKFKPTALLMFVALIGLIVILPILYFTINMDQQFLTIFVGACTIMLIFSIPAWLKVSKCPNCKKFMGREISKHCPNCGVQIKE